MKISKALCTINYRKLFKFDERVSMRWLQDWSQNWQKNRPKGQD